MKTLAQLHHLHATFMPKPIYGIAGSGMHVNLSLCKKGENAFHDPKGRLELSQDAYAFIAGMLLPMCRDGGHHQPLDQLLQAPGARLRRPATCPGRSPTAAFLVRVPAARAAAPGELRSRTPSCNPYLALALCLRAGLDGIQGLTPPAEIQGEHLHHGA